MIQITRPNIIGSIEWECPIKFDKTVKRIVLLTDENKPFGTARFEFEDDTESTISLAWWIDIAEEATTLEIKFIGVDKTLILSL